MIPLSTKSMLLVCLSFFGMACANTQTTRFILDADTGNEMDDLYAIVSAVADPQAELIALTSAHFNNPQLLTDSIWHIYPTKGIKPIEISQALNEELLEGLNLLSLPHPQGAAGMIGYAWGYERGWPIPEAPAIDFIIEQARAASPQNKLNVVVLGPVTNIAAAIEREPSIAPNIRCYMLGTKYDVEKQIWNKNSFNARNDINALDVLLNNADLELIVMPITIVYQFRFQREMTQKRLSTYDHPVAKMLNRRWDEVHAEKEWIMWDLALVEAILHPELATLEARQTPPENTQRMIQVYTDIDEAGMQAIFWEKFRKWFR